MDKQVGKQNKRDEKQIAR